MIAPSKLRNLVYENPRTSNAGFDVYVEPEQKHDYLITVDVARGVEKDYSAIASSEIINEQILDEKIEEDNHESTNPLILETEQKDDSNGLENFGIDEIEESTPDLFNSDENLEEKFTSFENSEKTKDEEDDLEIPAFLRRQKN